jgi:SAM-dependent methyltransferase
VSAAAIWHDVECSGYTADLAVWEELIEPLEGPVLDLGCGTGRVALHLARRGCDVWAADADPPLLEELAARAAAEGLAVRAICADVRSLELDRRFGLVIAPMQLLQMLGGRAGRRAALERAVAHLARGGRVAAAIVERAATHLRGPTAALPDVRERDGWVYSSLPVAVGTDEGDVEIRRWRQAVSPDGALSEEEHIDVLDALDAGALEAEGAAVGLQRGGRLEIPPADGYLGSVVLILDGP